jgi:4,5:9,10-diseco-3-hydroxy-5,9,17-trioxoandrosta-1(10),2-diene-4-oate hydrolase
VVEQGRGHPVLLFHGAGGWAETWGELIPALASAGYRVVACDLPGFGRSDPPRRARYFDATRCFYTRWVCDLMDALRLRRASMAGHSLGGTVAMLTAASAPERVSRLMLLAPGGFGDSVNLRLRMMGLPFTERLAPLLPDMVIRSFLRSCVYDPASIPEWLYEDACRYARAGSSVEMARVMSQGLGVFGASRALRECWARRIGRIRSPTLVLWGREDRTLPVSHAEEARRQILTSRVEVIDGAGHLLMVEKPRAVVREVLDFLEATRRARGSRNTGHAGTDFAIQPSL